MLPAVIFSQAISDAMKMHGIRSVAYQRPSQLTVSLHKPCHQRCRSISVLQGPPTSVTYCGNDAASDMTAISALTTRQSDEHRNASSVQMECEAIEKNSISDSMYSEWRYNSRIHHIRAGSAGPAVLLIHGFGVGAWQFKVPPTSYRYVHNLRFISV